MDARRLGKSTDTVKTKTNIPHGGVERLPQVWYVRGERRVKMSVRNFEEYRAEVLEALGAEYTDEDTRNFERYRLKVLENLSGDAKYKAYDAVIDFDADGSVFTFNILKGSYAEIVALLNDEVPPNILVKSWVKNNNGLSNAKTSSSVVLLYANNSELSDPYVAFTFYLHPTTSVIFYWHADDTVTPD